jgi:hypothetical protein
VGLAVGALLDADVQLFRLAGRPSDVIYPVRLNADGTRRRSSVFSTSPDGKRAGIMSFFRRSNSQSEASNGAPERDPDENANGRG